MFYSYDVATQAMRGHYLEVADGRGEYRTIPFRHVLAGRAGPDGPAGRDDPAGALGRLAA